MRCTDFGSVMKNSAERTQFTQGKLAQSREKLSSFDQRESKDSCSRTNKRSTQHREMGNFSRQDEVKFLTNLLLTS